MGWARVQPNCIQRDWNDRRKFLGHFPQAEYDATPAYDVMHQIRFAPAAGQPAELLPDGYWHKQIIKNNSRTETIDVLARTVRMAAEGILEGVHITLLPQMILSLCGTHQNTPTEIVSLGGEAEVEVFCIGYKDQVPA